jgi:hypothetical protein
MKRDTVTAFAIVVVLLVISWMSIRYWQKGTTFLFETSSPYAQAGDPSAKEQTPSWPVKGGGRAPRFSNVIFAVEDLDSGQKWTRDVSDELNGKALALGARATSLSLGAPLSPLSFTVPGLNSMMSAALKNSRTTLTGQYKYA